jgi:CheY-like chemotaxis protein
LRLLPEDSLDNETSEKRPAAPSAASIDEPLEATHGALPPDEDAEAFAQEAANAAAMAALDRSRGEPSSDEQAREGSPPEPTADEQALEQAGMTARPASPESLDEVDPAQIGEAAEEKESSFDKLQARATKLTAEQVRHVLHALLFVAEKPLTIEQLKQATGLESRRLGKALEKLGAGGHDLVISDLRMPELDGPGLYREIARRHPDMVPHVVFVTGDTLGPESVEFLQRTGVPTLGKPFDPGDIRRVVRQVLGGV